MTISNETITIKPSVGKDVPMVVAGHLLLIFYCLIFIFGFIGNVAVIYVGIRKKKYQNVTNCYVINLALADLLFLLLSIPYTTYLGLVDRYPFSDTFCKIHMYLAYVFLLATCNTLAAMSIDRYFYIVLPRSKLKFRTPHNAFLVCIVIWIGSFVLIIPYHILTTKIETCDINDQKNSLICLFVFCSYYAIPLMIIIICYTKLAIHVVRSNQIVVNQMNNENLRNLLKLKRRRVTKMVIVLTLAFAICWLPIHILELMQCAQSSILFKLLRTHPKFLYGIRVFSHALAYFNSCLNPYLYALLNRNFCIDLINSIFKRSSYSKSSNIRQTKLGHPSRIIFSISKRISNVNLSKNSLSDDDDDDEVFNHESIQLTTPDIK